LLTIKEQEVLKDLCKKYFVSDLHIGDGSRTDDFIYKDIFMDFLDQIIAEEDSQLIIVGDFLELWQADLEKILFYHSDLFAKLFRLAETDRVIYVYGNHDYLPFSRFKGSYFGNIKVLEQYIDQENGIWALHGHQFNEFNDIEQAKDRISGSIGQKIAEVVGFLERHLDEDIDIELAKMIPFFRTLKAKVNMLKRIVRCFVDKVFFTKEDDFTKEVIRIQSQTIPQDKNYQGAWAQYQQAVFSGLEEKGLKYGIIGHTHQEDLISDNGGKLYTNLGSWTNPNQDPYYALFEQGEMKLVNAKEEKISILV